MSALTFGTLAIGPLVILQPLWLLPAFLLTILAWRWDKAVVVNDWQAVMSPEVFNYLNGRSRRRRMANWLLWAASVIALCMTQPVIRQSDDDTWRHSIGSVSYTHLTLPTKA